MDSSYPQVRQDDGRVRFTVTLASAPRSKGAANIIAAIIALVVLGSTPAGGMTDVTANGLLTDVSRVMGLAAGQQR